MLMTAEGEFINARFGSRFMFSLLNQKIVLKPGKYVVLVDPLWDESTDNDEAYKEVLVDVYAPQSVNLTQVDDKVGIKILQKALKNVAEHKVPESVRENYLEENPDYSTDVYRVTDVESLDCYYGFIYTKNNSKYRLKETVRPHLKGLEINYPKVEGQDVEIDIPPGGDHIIILRRIGDRCSYGLAYKTHPRELNDFEMIEQAKNSEEVTHFGETNAYFSLYNDSYGAVFYIVN